MSKDITDRLNVERNNDENPNYTIRDGMGEVIAKVNWLSLQPSGTPIASSGFELGGTSQKIVKYANVHESEEPYTLAAGARIEIHE